MVEASISKEEILPWDGTLAESVYYGNGFEVEFILKEHWDTGYNANVKITNTSDETIENWALGFNYNDRISNIWNAKIVEDENKTEDENIAGENNNNTLDLNPIVIKNDIWNQDILPESSVEFGFSGTGDFKGFPSKYHILGEKRLVDPEDYYVEYSLSSDWGSGFNSSITVSNVSDKDIEDWILEFDFERDITNIWNGTIPSCEEDHYVIKNSGYNSIIYANHNIQFEFSGCNGDSNIVPTDYKLYYYDLSKEKVDNKEEKNSETNASQDENNINPVENEKEETNTENNQEEEKHTADANHEENLNGTQEEKHSDDAKPIDNGQTSEPDKEEQNNKVEEIDKTKDTDNDGLFDYIELQIGTDIEKTDSDGDGLSDYFEIMSMSYDPTRIDTDNNGINDGEEDLDDDGLTNLKEIEINTDPCKYDTDGDDVSDGKEIELGTDPLTYNDKFEVTVTADDVDTVKASVKISLTGKQVNTLSVNRFNNDFLFPEDMPGYIGGAYDFKVEGEFDQATLCFEFDEALLDEENFDPVIYYYDEEEQWLYELETTVEGNVATAATTHFSKYILINRMVFKNVFFDYWSQPDQVPMELVMVIDDSGTLGGRYGYDKEKGVFLGGTDPEHKRLKIAKNIVNGAEPKAVLNVTKADNTFDRTYHKNDFRKLTICNEKGKLELLDKLDFTKSEWCIDNPYRSFYWGQNKSCFDSCGGKSLCYTCFGALENFLGSSDDPTINKDYARVMLIISDGQVDDYDVNSEANMEGYSYSYIKKWANQMGVQIVTIGLGSDEDSFNKYLKPLSTATNGKFYYAKDLENVDNIYEYIKKDLGKNIELDSDSDGIPDAYEDGLLMFNGNSIRLDKNNPDTDGDGHLDGQEVELTYKYNEDCSKVLVIGRFKSNPLGEDYIDSDHKHYKMNETLLNNIYSLYELALEYSGEVPAEEEVSVWRTFNAYPTWLTFMFIKQFNENYHGENWPKVAGKDDSGFYDFVKNRNQDLYSYFEVTKDYYAQTDGAMGDLRHFAATMSCLIYHTSFDDANSFDEMKKTGLMLEKNIDALAGWAGDLQTAMYDATVAVGNDADYKTYKEAMSWLIACDSVEVYNKYPELDKLRAKNEDIHFKIDDLYADVDAYNLYKLLMQGYNFEDSVDKYFREEYKNRFSQFTDQMSKDQYRRKVYLYTKNYYLVNTTDFQWPIFNKCEIEVNDDLAMAARDAFTEYIYERIKNE